MSQIRILMVYHNSLPTLVIKNNTNSRRLPSNNNKDFMLLKTHAMIIFKRLLLRVCY